MQSAGPKTGVCWSWPHTYRIPNFIPELGRPLVWFCHACDIHFPDKILEGVCDCVPVRRAILALGMGV